MENPLDVRAPDELAARAASLKAKLFSLASEPGTAANVRLASDAGRRLVEAFWYAKTRAAGLALTLLPAPEADSGADPLVAHAFPLEMLALLLEAADVALAMDVLDATFFIGSLYSGLLSRSRRIELGAFHTPPALVNQLLDMVERSGHQWTRGAVLDPACGCGMFPVAIAQRMRAAQQELDAHAFLAGLPHALTGVELDPFAAWIAQVMLEVVLLPEMGAAGVRVPLLIRTQDALEMPQQASYDLVVGNPPYGKAQLSPAHRLRFARSLFGHANLYGLFMDQGVHWLRDKGLLAYVVPTSFLGGQYFKALRQLLAAQCPLDAVCFVDSRADVFDDVLQETVLAVFERRETSALVPGHRVRLETFSEPSSPTLLDADDPACQSLEFGLETGESPWLVPRSRAERAFTQGLRRMQGRLQDYGYRVSTGPLVWNRHKDQLLEAPLPSGLQRSYPLVWAESVRPEGFVLSAQKRNHAPWFSLRDGQGHLLTTHTCLVLQRTTSKEQHRRLLAAVIPEALVASHCGVVIENHLNVVSAAGKSPVSLEVLRLLLSNQSVDRAFRCISGSVAVSAYELESLPLPTLTQIQRLQADWLQHRSEEVFQLAVDALYAERAEPGA